MERDEREFFLKGLRLQMAARKLNQRSLAKLAGLSSVTISRYFSPNTDSFPADESVEKICSGLKMTADEIIRSALPAQVRLPEPPRFRSTPSDYMPVDEVMQSMSAVSAAYMKIDARLKYWMGIVEALPVAVVVVRDGLLYTQNRASRALWQGVGRPLCDNCKDPKCAECGCEIKKAVDSGLDIERLKNIDGVAYKMQTTHFQANDHNYHIVTMTCVEIR